MKHLLSLALLCWPAAAQLAAPNAEGVAAGHLHINIADVTGHRKFWGEVMGGQASKLGNMDCYKFNGIIVLVRQIESAGGTTGSSVHHLGFAVRNLAETVAKARAAGFPLVRELPATKQAFIMAPGEVQVELSEDPAMTQPAAHHHIHFYGPEELDMRAWYVKMFGAKPGKRGKFEAADVPGANLSFSKSSTPVTPTKGRVMDHIGFEVSNLDAFAKRLEGMGVKFDMPVRDIPQLKIKIAFITDPWGTYIELTEGLNKL